MFRDPLVSLIIPVYDVSDYLKRCIDSCLAQTLESIEIILVNDCSPDPLDNIFCEEYAATDDRIKYVRHECNKGLGGARNTGLENAKGEYVWFIDSDDFIDNSACEFLHRIAKEKRADIIGFSATSHVNGVLDLAGQPYYYYQRDTRILDQLLSGEDFIRQAMDYNSFLVSACLHFFRREVFGKYRFRESVTHEDVDTVPIVIRDAKSVYCVKYAPYYRLLRENSITQQRMDAKRLGDLHAATLKLLAYIRETGLHSSDSLASYTNRLFHRNLLPALNALEANQQSTNLSVRTHRLMQEFPEILSSLENQQASQTYNELQMTLTSTCKQLEDVTRELTNIKHSRVWKLRSALTALKNRFTAS